MGPPEANICYFRSDRTLSKGERGREDGEPSYPKLDADKHDGSEFGDDLVRRSVNSLSHLYSEFIGRLHNR